MNPNERQFHEYKHRHLFRRNKKKVWFLIGTGFSLAAFTHELNSGGFWFMIGIGSILYLVGLATVYLTRKEEQENY